MRKGELIVLNAIFSGKVRLPKLTGDTLYGILSAKADISRLAEGINGKAEAIKRDTMPEGVDPYSVSEEDPAVKAWVAAYVPMQNRLYNEELEAELPAPCVPREVFPDLCEGLTPGEAEMLLKYIVKR